MVHLGIQIWAVDATARGIGAIYFETRAGLEIRQVERFRSDRARRPFPTQNRKPGPRLNTNWFMTPPFSTTTQPPTQTNL
jgi:hypothetical protein